jgi:hypothetical protein
MNMAINDSAFASKFGNGFGRGRTQGTSTEDRPKAKYWLNVGYLADHIVDGEDEPRFIALPVGIPLDTTEPAQVRGSNELYRAMVTAQNDLLADIVSEASKLEPGQAVIIGDPENQPLVLQLRRVAAEQEAIKPDENPFGKGSNRLKLVA